MKAWRELAAAAAAIMAIGATGGAVAQVPPMTPELQKIVAAAKTEKLVLSSSGEAVLGGPPTEAAAKAWIKQNFGVDVDFQFTTGGPFGVVGSRLVTEFRAGQPSSADIWAASVPQYDPVLKLNMFVKVPWLTLFPERIPPQAVAADGYSLSFSTGTPGILYNLEKGGDFAKVKVIDDLLKPEYKGKFGTTAFANGFDAMSAKGWEGEARMLDYIAKLGKQAQGILNCGGQDRVASGEFLALVMDCTGSSPNTAQYRGKLGLDIPVDEAQLQYYDLLIPKNAQHPNAAILFMLFLMTQEGQRLLAENLGIDLDYFPETRQHKMIADLEAKGVKFHRIDYQWWLANPGVDASGFKLGKALKAAIGG